MTDDRRPADGPKQGRMRRRSTALIATAALIGMTMVVVAVGAVTLGWGLDPLATSRVVAKAASEGRSAAVGGTAESPALVTPVGFRSLTDEELAADFVNERGSGNPDTPGLADEITYYTVVKNCMLDAGFVFDPMMMWRQLAQGVDDWLTRGLTPEQSSAYELALSGPAEFDGGPWTWERGGCRGVAVHETGLFGPSQPAEQIPVDSSTTLGTPYNGPLLHFEGSYDVTRADLEEYARIMGFAESDPDGVWVEQQLLDIECMAEEGFLFDPLRGSRERVISGMEPAREAGLTGGQIDRFNLAMHGAYTSGPYDWRRAGCHGRSVHETGMDGMS